ncbi:MAG: alpha/beta fold hydrolase, partial [Microcystaceae cyanobacterium]
MNQHYLDYTDGRRWMPTLQANGINLFYDLEGTGEPLLLISGFGCDHSYWSLIMPSLVSHYQVIGLDNRGSGQSSTPPGPYSIKQMATDVALLLEHLGLAQVQVVGHSMGGQIAQELALSFPSKVRSLALLASWARGDARFNTVIETFGELPRSVKLNLYQKVVLPWMYAEDFFS